MALVAEGYSDAAAARAVGVSQKAVWNWRRAAGYAARRSNEKVDAPRRLRQKPARRARTTIPGRLLDAAEALDLLPEAAGPRQPGRVRRPASMPSPQVIARAAAKARAVAAAQARGQAASSSSLAPAHAVARRGLDEFENSAPAARTSRMRGRPVAPVEDGTWRVQLGPCGHAVRGRDTVGAVVACAACGGAPMRVVALFAPGERVGPRFG